MSKKLSYWDKRKIQIEQANFKKSTEFIEWLNNEYDRALNDINRNIYKHLSDIAEDNQISISDAKKLLNDNELKDFKIDLSRFTKLSQGDMSKETELMLNNASNRFRISRLQAIEINTRATVNQLLTTEQKAVFAYLAKSYKDNFYHMTYDLQKTTGYKHINGINQRKLDIILNKPWANDGKNFSERIWGRNDKIVNELHKELYQNIVRGKGLDEISKDVAKKFETSKRNARRLVYTESSAMTAAADEASYKETKVNQYQILATLDNRTSEICRDMDGKIFNITEYKVGVTASPFHVNCRSTTVPYYDDFNENATRAARSQRTGKTETIPYMNYGEWYKKYVKTI